MSIIDTIYTYKFIRTLSTPWIDQDAFKLGIIDKDGTVLRKARTLKTQVEKDAYTSFHRLAWNIKRMVQKMPGGGSKMANYASALFLIKEQGDHMGISKIEMNLFEQAIEKKLTEEPTNVIGDAGENDNIKTFDPKLGKTIRKRKKKVDETDGVTDADADDYEKKKKKTPAVVNEVITDDILTIDEGKAVKFTMKMFKDNEKYNEHTTNAVMLVMKFGTKEERKKVEQIAGKHLAKGHIEQRDQQERDAFVRKYIKNLKEDVEPNTFNTIKEAMKRRKKRDASGKVKKFYKRVGACPPGKVKNREGGCDKIGGNQSLQQIKKTRKITQRKRKKTLKKKGNSFWRMADMRRKKTTRA